MNTLMSLINSLVNPSTPPDFVFLGVFVAVVGYIGFHISTGSVPGIPGLILPAAAGGILGMMLYIFVIGTS